ncbi:Transcription factor [Penicillium lagena]|uniref:Transcription factor n=1 Tax=Penicillium lagena TaxID=94218 RepID=UPI002542209D|nr:Transcription factor [Penicillium lagena]KAJ5601229.1 Transcription factor [Penicillium lagena]
MVALTAFFEESYQSSIPHFADSSVHERLVHEDHQLDNAFSKDLSDKDAGKHPPPAAHLPVHLGKSTDKSEGPRYSNVAYSEYDFIDSYSLSSLPPEDMQFLASKCSLTLPEKDAMDEFVHQYFRHIHPVVPVLDEGEFWRIYEGDPGPDRLSIFVFQAVLFASCPFVSLETLYRCGFNDKRDARNQLTNFVLVLEQLLFDLKAEVRPSAKAQGAVLLTHHTSADHPQAGSLWLARAIENALIIGAQPSMLDEHLRDSLKKRLWWSILLRDRSLCIGLRRRPQITSINLHGWSDWLREEDFAEELHSSRVYDLDAKRLLLQALQEQCRLAVLLTDLVSFIFCPRVKPTCFLSVEEFHGAMSNIERIRESLIEWEMQTQPALRLDAAPDAYGPVATIINLTYMYYHAARVDLAQYAAFMIEENLSYARETHKQQIFKIGQDLKGAIESLTTIMEFFSANGRVNSLPLSILGYVGMPLVLAAIDLKLSPSHEEMMIRQKRLHSISGIIRQSETLYDVTDFVAAGTNHILQLAYWTTQNLFLGWEHHAKRNAPVDQLKRSCLSDNPSDSDLVKGLNSRFRVKSWLDAFIYFPRAYLLISTSVDYSLAVGRLPYEHALPELVRHIPSMGATSRLPWTISVRPVSKQKPSSSSRQKRRNMGVRSESVETRTTVQTISTETAEGAPHRRESYTDERTTLPSSGPGAPEQALEPPNQTSNQADNVESKTWRQCEVNLDFMDLKNVPNAPGGLSPAIPPQFEEESAAPGATRATRKEQVQVHHESFETENIEVKGFNRILMNSLFHNSSGEEWDELYHSSFQATC